MSRTNTKVHPKRTTDTVEQILSLFHAIASSTDAVDALAQRLDPPLLEVLSQLGFVRTEKHAAAKLPPLLANFSILQENEQVARILDDPSFQAAQDAVQKNPTDDEAVKRLREATKVAKAAYEVAIQTRLQEENLKITCRKVVDAGNENFLAVYVLFRCFFTASIYISIYPFIH